MTKIRKVTNLKSTPNKKRPPKNYTMARIILDTVPDPLLILNSSFEVLDASRSFYDTFQVIPEDTEGRTLYEIGSKQWDIDELRTLFDAVIPNNANIDSYEVEHEFPTIGLRTMLLNARQIIYSRGQRKELLVTIYDITAERKLEREKAEAIKEKELMINEMRHRIANSLQLVANTLQIKAQSTKSAEVRTHLEDAYKRLLSIGAIQNHLAPVRSEEEVDFARYLVSLSKNITEAMIEPDENIQVIVKAEPESLSANQAMTLGLITTELVINALKHAFLKPSGNITVEYKSGEKWSLTVSDDGKGLTDMRKEGVGTELISSLAKQVKATVTTESNENGTITTITST